MAVHNGDKRSACRILVRKSEGKKPLGRPSPRWVDNIKMDLVKIGCGGVDWTPVAQDVVVWTGLPWLRIGTGSKKMVDKCRVAPE
jgi:hypothetical protein